MRNHATLVTCLLGLTIAIAPASNAYAMRGACHDDARALCADLQRGDRGAMHQCLMEHQDQLSDACVARIEQGRQRAQACQVDVQSLCPNLAEGDRRGVHQCLMENESALSDGCRAVFENHGPGRGSHSKGS